MLHPVKDFAEYDELARPLPQEESRVFDTGRNKVCYRAYRLALAETKVSKILTILVEHGGGKEIIRIESQWISKEPLLAMMQINERGLYAILFAMYKTACEAADFATKATASKYRTAFADGRLMKRKIRGQSAYKVWIEDKKIESAAA